MLGAAWDREWEWKREWDGGVPAHDMLGGFVGYGWLIRGGRSRGSSNDLRYDVVQ